MCRDIMSHAFCQMDLFDEDDLGSFTDNVWGGFELRFIADSDEYTVKVVVTFTDSMLVNVFQTGVCLDIFCVCVLLVPTCGAPLLLRYFDYSPLHGL